MQEIVGVFNNEKSAELVIRGLESLNNRADVWIRTDSGDWYSEDLQELKQVVTAKGSSKNSIAYCPYKASLSMNGVDGAFACWSGDMLHIARDIIGIKPLFFAHAGGFAFASEKKVLEAMGFSHALELDPRVLLKYRVKEDRLCFVKRDFFSTVPEIKEDKERIKEALLKLLRDSITSRIPREEKFGVLFSGGLDSTLIASICKDLDADFVCYTVAVEEPGMKEAEDLIYAKRIAADLGFELKIKKIRVDEVEKYLREVVPLMADTDVVQITVALPLYAAGAFAKEEGTSTVLYGLGAEELFAGYARHKQLKEADLNAECLSCVSRMHARDLYRDDLVAKSLSISLRAPFLAPNLVDYALRIPATYKLSGGENKVILREIARDLGLGEVASRKKRAVQYGSNVIKAIEKLAKREGFRYKSDYLWSFYPARDVKLGCLFSSGKDSAYALWLMQKAGYPVACLITVKSRNPESYMFHTPAVELTKLQAEAIGLPLVMKETAGEKEKELEDLRDAFRVAKAKYAIEGVITGALWSTYQKERIERIAAEENLRVLAPLWHINQETEMRLVVATFAVIFSAISAYGLDRSWLGRRITDADVDRLVGLDVAMNVSGEGGEFESLVLDGPMFRKRLVIVKSEIVEVDENTARLVVKEAKLVSGVN